MLKGKNILLHFTHEVELFIFVVKHGKSQTGVIHSFKYKFYIKKTNVGNITVFFKLSKNQMRLIKVLLMTNIIIKAFVFRNHLHQLITLSSYVSIFMKKNYDDDIRQDSTFFINLQKES